MKNVLFITATDTGVGKTTVSAALASIAKDAGIEVGYFKPVETGCNNYCSDAKLLSGITGQKYEETVMYRFKEPVAPYVAELEEKVKIDIEKIKGYIDFLKEKYDFLIIEGAGGVAVPITKVKSRVYTYLDLLSEINIPSIIVSRASLGTINHTYLTVKSMKQRNIQIKGIILNGFPEKPSLSEKTNPFIIKEMIGIDILTICRESKKPVLECIEKIKEYIGEFQYLL